VRLAIGKGSVNIVSDSNHITSHIFFGIFIAGKVALYVTKSALHAQRRPKRSHGLLNIDIGGQHFEVFRRPGRGSSLPAATSAILAYQTARANQE
jgi:uncharacterized protein YfeS